MSHLSAISFLFIPVVISIYVGYRLLKRAISQPKIFPEDVVLGLAWIFVVGGFVWLEAFLTNSTLLGFNAPWTWLAAVHFFVAGFGAITVTALSCRIVSNKRCLKGLRILLGIHPVAYLITAVGISGIPYFGFLGALLYEILFVFQLIFVLNGRPLNIYSIQQIFLFVALTTPIITMVFSIAWAFGEPIFDMNKMIKYHGLVNAIGHVGLGLIVLNFGKRPSYLQPIETK